LQTVETETDFEKMSDKAIFLNRDDTLIEDPGYISDPEQVRLLDGVPEALVQFRSLGYKLIVVTNQSGVAHGIVTEKALGEIHDRLKQLLADKNAYLDRIYYCPYHPEGIIQKYRKESESRKPAPGMLLKAAEEMDIDLRQSWCIGNKGRDIEAGRRAGCKTMLIDLPPARQKQVSPSASLAVANPDYKAVNVKEAVNIIKKHLRSVGEEQKHAQAFAAGQKETGTRIDEELADAAESSEQIEPSQEVPEPQEVRMAPADNEEESAEPVTAEPESETEAAEPQIQPAESRDQRLEQEIAAGKTEELLGGILLQLKSMQRNQMFGEFSIMRLLAGILQIVVLFCLLIAVWFLMSPDRQDNLVFITLGFAVVLQLMTLTFYIMQGKK
jgi:D-glycero-D-manno-heptose 1,7-bisphosphate phosphatase